ncbi:hypothetical protein BZA05DRAFT_177210 [Tricharina praecox]|uniref:uncharacterized protein n=1 Tax=Tricharina praecox TaxID=43433 RepID=UPI0022203F77|nr:uncharacterized protein BZA05DRAFT_177210 [Tricharina praecox]KAI5844159.1 hypothetical protein BZA05DRAFT_177210 [Tricharina praecox]
MLPRHIAEATTAVRVSGRRICTSNGRRPSRHHCAQLHNAAATTTTVNCCPSSPWGPARRPTTGKSSQRFPVDVLFVKALVKASLCRVHSVSYHVCARPSLSKPSFSRKPSTARRDLSDDATSPPPQTGTFRVVPQVFRPQLRAIVDPIDRGPIATSKTSHRQPKDSRPIRPRIERIPKEDQEKYKMPWLFPSSWEERDAISAFRAEIRNKESTNESLFELYRNLPGSRLPYLDRITMERFIVRLMTVPLRDQVAMLRYLTLIEDMKASKIPITRHEWNQAMSFVLKAFKQTTAAEMRAAYELWAQSEGDHGVNADLTTFNILLDGASNSKSPALAQSILKEMRTRNMKYDRFTYTALMMYHAHIGDGAKIRQVYQGLVDAGEIVDTVVLNTLMTALVIVGEEDDALRIFAFMKRAGAIAEKSPTPEMVEYRACRSFAQKLKRPGARNSKRYMEELKVVLGPDIGSFHLFVHLNCRKANWDRAQDFIRDMKTFGLVLPDSVYLSLLKGFAWWGSPDPYGQWNPARLENVLNVVLDEQAGLIKWQRVYAVWVVRAVAKVYVNGEVLERVWQEVMQQWKRQGGTVHEFALGVYFAALRDVHEAQNQHLTAEQQMPPLGRDMYSEQLSGFQEQFSQQTEEDSQQAPQYQQQEQERHPFDDL